MPNLTSVINIYLTYAGSSHSSNQYFFIQEHTLDQLSVSKSFLETKWGSHFNFLLSVHITP